MSIFRRKKQKRTDDTDGMIDLDTVADAYREAHERESADTGDDNDDVGSARPRRFLNARFAAIAYGFLVVFLALIIYFVKVIYVDGDTIINNPYNKRTDVYSERVVRGDILSSDGEILATTVTDPDGNETRYYPYGEKFSHAVGYMINGQYGIESSANFYMLRSHAFLLKYLANEITGQKNPGDTVVTSLNASLQERAYDALGDNDGAVVVMEPSTGRILAMVSKPAFDPNTLGESWDDIVSDEDSSVLLNRAAQGLYPPGSAFKIFAAMEYLREHGYDDSDFSYNCSGSIDGITTTIHCYKNNKHGELTLKKAFAKSCNSAFASMYDLIDIADYCKLVNESLFGVDLPTDFASSVSAFSLDTTSGQDEIMATLMGQGKTQVTPLHMALLMSALDNGGVLMRPLEVDRVINEEGDTVKEFAPSEYGSLFTEDDCKALLEYMRYTVTDGTAAALDTGSYTVGGKTGTAEFSDSVDSAHAWFIGYAKAEGYNDIVISVIVEDSGSGSEYAVPVAKRVFDKYFE